MEILNHPLISQRYLFPRRQPAPTPAFVVDCDGAQLYCHRIQRNPDALTVVHFHGNGELINDYLPDFARALEPPGANLIFVEYRGYGESTGTALLGGMLDDVHHVVRASGVAPERLVAFGRSIGSLCAVELVHRYPTAAGLILESGIADVFERIATRVSPDEMGLTDAALRAAVLARVDQPAKLGAYRGPALIMHAAQDWMVRVSHAERLAAACEPSRTQLLIFPQGDHNSIIDVNWSSYFAAVNAFLTKL